MGDSGITSHGSTGSVDLSLEVDLSSNANGSSASAACCELESSGPAAQTHSRGATEEAEGSSDPVASVPEAEDQGNLELQR